MKRFRFPLQPVVVLRSHQESRAREAFAAAVHGYVQAEELLQAARQRVADLGAALSSGRAGSFSAAEQAHQLQGYRREAEAELAAERTMITARDLMARRRGEYIEAHRQLEVVNRLGAKARATHRAAASREEQAEFDEFATRRAFRREVAVSP